MSDRCVEAMIRVEASPARRVVMVLLPDGSRLEFTPAESKGLRNLLERAEETIATAKVAG